MTAIELRPARPEDRDFLHSLSPRLSGVPGPLRVGNPVDPRANDTGVIPA